MKKKKLAIASLLMALLMPLAVYAEGDDTLSTNGEAPVETYAATDVPAEVTPTEWPDTADWTVSCSKKATSLDENYTSEVTLSLPSEEEELTTDVVFVLDGSSSTDKAVVRDSLSLLEELKQSVADNGAAVNVCVVKFKRQAFKSGWYNLSTNFDAIKAAMETTYNGGSNIHAGLLAGKEALSEHANVATSRKYLILISDGSTYLYSKDGDWANDRPFTRSYYSRDNYSGAAGGFNDQGLYNPDNYTCNVSRPQKTSDVAAWQAYFNDVEARNNESHGDNYDYRSNYDSVKEEWALSDDFKTQPSDERSANNRDMAYYYANQAWQEIKSAGYNAYSIATADGSAGADNSNDSHSFMNYLNGGKSLNFSDIEKEVLYAVDKNSKVEDVIGNDFTLDVDSLSISVGGKGLTKASNGENSWMFGDDENVTERFSVSYEPETKKITWHINKPITNFAHVQLSYKVKLNNPETEPGAHSAFTNEWAKLYPVDSNSTPLPEIDFPKPEVSYTIYALNYNANGGSGTPVGETNCTGKFTVSNTVPTRNGYIFAGWNTAADGSGTNYTAGSEVALTQEVPSLTLYAQWNKLVTVSFDLCGHGGTIASQTFVSGGKASEPTAPKEDGWVFGGWYTEKNCQHRFNFDSTVNSDIVLYAKWDRVAVTAPSTTATPAPTAAPAVTPAPSAKAAAVKASIPQTRDVFPLEGLVALFVIGVAGVGTVWFLRKKRR